MALDVATFVAKFPEFDEIGDNAPATILSALSTAATFVSAQRFGTRYEDAVLYKAADLLALTPMGENARLEKGSAETTYGIVFKQMLRALPVRFLVPGMSNT